MTRAGRFVALLMLVAVAFLYPLVAPTPHRIDDAHFELIRVGMTEAEVAGIFGVLPGNYDWAVHDETEFFTAALAVVDSAVISAARRLEDAVPAKVLPWEGETRMWVSRHGAYRIQLGEGGEVLHASKHGKTRLEYPWHNWRRFRIGR
jgi:hypothetical protein